MGRCRLAFPGAKPSICFVALNSYNVLAGEQDLKHVGGAEVQQTIIGRWLAARGYGVRFVTLDHGQEEGIVCDSIFVHKAYRKADGFPVARFLVPRWSGLWSALRRAQSDVYYQRGSGVETGQTALWCRLHRRRFVFGVANEADCIRNLPFLHAPRERVLYRLGLHLADAVVAQTYTQQELLLRNFSIRSTVVRNSGPEIVDPPESVGVGRAEPLVLWIGRIVPVKRFEWLLDVANRCSDVKFQIVGAVNQDSRYAAELIGRARECPNISFQGEVPHAQMEGFYIGAKLLLCTSRQEGFPNTFLEAWRLGLPVVTTFDPDGLVRLNRLGLVGSTVDEVVEGLRKLLSDSLEYEHVSASARTYFASHHTAAVVLPAFERVIEGLFENESPRGHL